MNKIHAMIDLETLATTDDAVITQIGLVFFDIDGPRHDGSHEWIVNAQAQPQRAIDSDTMQWHLSEAGRALQLGRSYSNESLALGLALEYLVEEIKLAGPSYIWAKSPTFDLRILAHAMRGPERFMPAMDVPWKFHQERDVRTAFDFLKLAGNPPVLAKAHRANLDALEQADWVARALRIARDASNANKAADEPSEITRVPEPCDHPSGRWG